MILDKSSLGDIPVINVDADPSVTPVDAPKGSLIYWDDGTNPPNWFMKYDDGETTNVRATLGQGTVVQAYNQPVGTQLADIDTGVSIDPCRDWDEYIFELIFTIDATSRQYSILQPFICGPVKDHPDVEYVRTTEAPGAGGDVDVSVWLDSGTDTIHYRWDVDGAGKTVNNAILTVVLRG